MYFIKCLFVPNLAMCKRVSAQGESVVEVVGGVWSARIVQASIQENSVRAREG